MRRFHEAGGVGEAYSPAEELFNRRRRTAGLVVGPLLALALLLLPMPGLSEAAHRLAGVMVLMIVLWMTEAIPLAVTALLGPTLIVLLGVAPARAAFAPFADPIIFLFIGSFILAQAMFVHRLDRRMAYSALASPWIGSSAWRLVLVYASVCAGLSMWMSNTATTAMFFPLGMAVLAELGRGRETDPAFRHAVELGLDPLVPIVWRKISNRPNAFLGSGFLLVNIYVSQDCELVMVFRKGSIRKFSREEAERRRQSRISRAERDLWCSQVWDIPGKRGAGATSSWPREVPHRLVRMFSIIGDTVLDPFCGQGDEELCLSLGRHYIGCTLP